MPAVTGSMSPAYEQPLRADLGSTVGSGVFSQTSSCDLDTAPCFLAHAVRHFRMWVMWRAAGSVEAGLTFPC